VICPCGGRLSLEVCRRNGRVNAYLVCASKNRGTCNARNIRYDEDELLRAFMQFRWARFFDRPADNKRRRELDRQVRDAEALLAKQRQHQQKAESNLSELLLAGSLDADTAALLGKAAKDARHQADATEGSLGELRGQLRQASLRPDGATMQKEILDRVEAFMATGRHDPADRVRLNTWLNTLGVSAYLYRDQQGHTVMDSTIEDAIGLGVDDAGIEALRAQMLRSMAQG
jgi:hypothetical protein